MLLFQAVCCYDVQAYRFFLPSFYQQHVTKSVEGPEEEEIKGYPDRIAIILKKARKPDEIDQLYIII